MAAATRSAAVIMPPPRKGREDILKRLVSTPFRGCGIRPPPLASVRVGLDESRPTRTASRGRARPTD